MLYLRSSGDADELSAAAIWMYKATGENSYLTDAKAFYPAGTAWGFGWNDANVGAAVMINKSNRQTFISNKRDTKMSILLKNGLCPNTQCQKSYLVITKAWNRVVHCCDTKAST